MKDLTKQQLRKLLERAYGEGFQSGVDAVSPGDWESGLRVDTMDTESRDELIESFIDDL